MATESVAPVLTTKPVSHPDYIYSDDDPFERIVQRLNGIEAMTVIASAAMDSDSSPTERVWKNWLFSLGLLSEDIARDLEQMRQIDRCVFEPIARTKS